jgi:hypothetical protein
MVEGGTMKERRMVEEVRLVGERGNGDWEERLVFGKGGW